MPTITLKFDSDWATRVYEADGDYSIYVLLEELLHRLTKKEDGND